MCSIFSSANVKSDVKVVNIRSDFTYALPQKKNNEKLSNIGVRFNTSVDPRVGIHRSASMTVNKVLFSSVALYPIKDTLRIACIHVYMLSLLMKRGSNPASFCKTQPSVFN